MRFRNRKNRGTFLKTGQSYIKNNDQTLYRFILLCMQKSPILLSTGIINEVFCNPIEVLAKMLQNLARTRPFDFEKAKRILSINSDVLNEMDIQSKEILLSHVELDNLINSHNHLTDLTHAKGKSSQQKNLSKIRKSKPLKPDILKR